MSNKSVCISLIATLTAFALPGLPQAEAQQGAKVDLSGSYRCEPQPSPRQTSSQQARRIFPPTA
jgi:hypothetical protein